MADPQEGFNSGVDRSTSGSSNAEGNFVESNNTGSIVPSNYAAAPVTLLTVGVSLGEMATGAKTLSIGATAVGAVTPVVMAFGTSASAAIAAIDATAGSEVGHMLAIAAVGDVVEIGIPSSLGTNPYAAAACLDASTVKVMASQGK